VPPLVFCDSIFQTRSIYGNAPKTSFPEKALQFSAISQIFVLNIHRFPREPHLKTNLEVIQGIYKGDAEQIAKNLQAALAPRFDWTEAAGFPYAGTFHTLEEVGMNVFARLSTEWIDYRAETESFFDAGDTIVVTGYYKGTYRQSGGIMDARFAHIWTFKDGKIVKYIQNVDTKKVWDAIGGSR